MDEEVSLRRFGLRPSTHDLDEVRQILRTRTALERRRQGDGDAELMKLCCVQLFTVGLIDDVRAIWLAKESSFDAHCSIDAQLLCGAGLGQTKISLADEHSPWTTDVLGYLLRWEAGGGFVDFSAASPADRYRDYYRS